MKKALFLDRDGVINEEIHYLYKKEDFVFIDGIFELVRHYKSLDYYVFVVTNQSGIARKYYTEDDFNLLTTWMQSEFLKEDIVIDAVYFCPHHPDISGKCTCRKPEPGMLLEAAKMYDVDLKESIMIGDKERDIEAGLNAGIKETYLFNANETISVSKASKIVSRLEEIWK